MTPAARRRNTWNTPEERSGTAREAPSTHGERGSMEPFVEAVEPVVGVQPAAPPPIRVQLPWPARALHPNSRSKHWGGRATAAKKARIDAAWEAKAAGLSTFKADSINASLTFHAPDNRRRDLDSMLASMKSALDGLADVIGVDDSRWSLSIRKAEPRPPHGAVIVEISVAA